MLSLYMSGRQEKCMIFLWKWKEMLRNRINFSYVILLTLLILILFYNTFFFLYIYIFTVFYFYPSFEFFIIFVASFFVWCTLVNLLSIYVFFFLLLFFIRRTPAAYFRVFSLIFTMQEIIVNSSFYEWDCLFVKKNISLNQNLCRFCWSQWLWNMLTQSYPIFIQVDFSFLR